MEWLPTLKIYLGKYYIITEKEFELLNNFNHEYKKPSPIELLEIFPEAGPIIKRNYRISNEKKAKVREICGKYLAKAHIILYEMTEGLPVEIKKEIENHINKIFYYYPMKKYNRQVRQLDQLLKIMDWKRKPKDLKNITDQDIAMAKQIPLSNFMEFNRAGFALCPLHNEKTPSFKYYPNENRFHCFSCNENGDIIDYVQKIYKLDFITAVKKLLNK